VLVFQYLPLARPRGVESARSISWPNGEKSGFTFMFSLFAYGHSYL